MKFRVSTRSLRYHLHRLFNRKTTMLDGLRLTCDPRAVNRSVAREIIKGSYEKAERDLARKALRAGDKVVEIGAGVGVVSLLCSKLSGPGNVVSYEANADLAPVIRENFALNGIEPDLRLRAVTTDGKPVVFYRNANVVSSSVYDRGLQAEKTVVESRAINDVLSEAKATVLVMDVEGAEVDLLRAADLSNIREMIVEIHPHIVGEDAIGDLLTHLQESGFTLAERQHKTVRLSRAA